MPGMLRASAIGHLGGDPETRTLDSGQTVTSFSVGCSVGSKAKEHSEWVRVSAWGKIGEVAAQYLEKGRLVYVEGRLTSRSYDGQDGKTRYSLELNADTLQLIDSRGQERSVSAPEAETARDLDSIPF